MNIRWKLTFRFASIVAVILLVFSAEIYFFSYNFRLKQFHSRLKDRALNTVRIVIAIKDIDSTLLTIIDKNVAHLYEEKLLFIDQNNREFFDNKIDDTGDYTISDFEMIRKAGMLEFSKGQREAFGMTFFNKGKECLIIASAYDKFGRDKLKNLIWIMLVALITGVGLALAFGIRFSSEALNPISSVINQVNKISAFNLHLRVNEGNKKDEIAQLAMTFNKMLGRLESSFEMQRSFISNVSHELRTPLTYMLGEVEVLLLDERPKEEYIQLLQVLSNDIKDTTGLLNNLLNLAQASMDISAFKFEPTRIDEILLLARIELLKSHPDYSILMSFEDLPEEMEELNLQANEQLLKSAFLNLMDNGCKFSDNHEVQVVLRVSGTNFIITLTDNGIGISEPDLEKILNKPFFRAENARNRKGSGIGLALTSRIIQLHQARMEISSEPDKGSIFTIYLRRDQATRSMN